MNFFLEKPFQLRSKAKKPLVNFSYTETNFSYPNAWHDFIFSIYNKDSIKYQLDTGRILLNAVGTSALKIEDSSKFYQKVLTPEGFQKEGEKFFSELIGIFPKGPYEISIQTIPEPYLVWPEMVGEDLNDSRVDKMLSVKEKTTTPNLLIPTQCLSKLSDNTIEKYLEDLEAGTITYPLLLKEPHNIAQLHEQYHPKGYENKLSPPYFGFNGNHLYFDKRNFYILDGHHRLAAYELEKKNPTVIVIEFLGPINL
ncbi:MAG: hypothetical protein V7677_18675 [Motiliproteus sp.]